jgi:hypothetical protein
LTATIEPAWRMGPNSALTTDSDEKLATKTFRQRSHQLATQAPRFATLGTIQFYGQVSGPEGNFPLLHISRVFKTDFTLIPHTNINGTSRRNRERKHKWHQSQ